MYVNQTHKMENKPGVKYRVKRRLAGFLFATDLTVAPVSILNEPAWQALFLSGSFMPEKIFTVTAVVKILVVCPANKLHNEGHSRAGRSPAQ